VAKQAVYIQKGEILDYYNAGSALTAGTVVVIGNHVGVCATDIGALETGAVFVSGVFEMATVTNASFAIGDVLYWDDSAKNLTKTASSHKVAGMCASVKETAGAKALVKLNA